MSMLITPDNPLAGQFDIWGNHDRELTAKPALTTFAEDDVGPAGFHLHMQRVHAGDRRAALAAYRRNVAASKTPTQQ